MYPASCMYPDTCSSGIHVSGRHVSWCKRGIILGLIVGLYSATYRPRSELNIVFMTSSVDYSNLRGVCYLATSGYPLSWSSGLNRCRIVVPVDSVVTWSLLDVRGRTINMAAICTYRLLITTATQRHRLSSSLINTLYSYITHLFHFHDILPYHEKA